MSLDQAKAFIEKMKSDKAFREKVLAIEDVAGRLQLINSEGFTCTNEEIKAVSAELSDEDLDNLSGGWLKFNSCCGEGFGYGVNKQS